MKIHPSLILSLALLAPQPLLHAAGAPTSLPPSPQPVAVAGKIASKAEPFDLHNVRLLDGPFKAAMELDKAYLLSLDPDRLLHTFRLTAGLPTSAQPYGGWESPGGELRGHSMGHYLSACALMYASTGDERFKARVDAIVEALAKCQEALPAKGFNKGFLSAYPEEFFDRVDACQRVWAPYYTLHKIMAGLLDAHLQCGNPQALDVLNKMAGWLKFRVGRLTHEQQQKALGSEHGGMNEVLANLYAITGNPDHLQLAKDFNHESIFEPLAHGEDKLGGCHANTQIPKIIGAEREYELTGDASLHTVATTFWRAVALNRSYAIGGHSDREHFFPIADFAKHLSPLTCESCNTYNMLKLTRNLFGLEPSAELMDFYERGLFNQILGSVEPRKGMFTYFQSLKPGHFKVYSRPEDSFWCCVGTGMENHAKYADSIYFHDADSLYLNLFIASELNWKEKGLVVRQETQFPENETSQLSFKCAKPVSLALKVRWPSWAQNGLTVAINGVEQKVQGAPGSYITLKRKWRDGDQVQLRVPMSLRTEELPGGNPRIVAVLKGPIVLAGELGTEGLENVDFWLKAQDYLLYFPTPRLPQMVCEPAELPGKLEPVEGKPLTYRTKGIGRPTEITLSPFYKLHFQRYSVYWNLFSEADWKQNQEQIAAQDAARRALEERILDSVAPGEQQSETDRKFKGEKSHLGASSQLKWRTADNGWFSYELKVTADQPATLRCTYLARARPGQFDLLVEGEKIATQTLPLPNKEDLVDVDYSIPARLTQGKERVTVKFQAQANSSVGALHGVLMLKEQPPTQAK